MSKFLYHKCILILLSLLSFILLLRFLTCLHWPPYSFILSHSRTFLCLLFFLLQNSTLLYSSSCFHSTLLNSSDHHLFLLLTLSLLLHLLMCYMFFFILLHLFFVFVSALLLHFVLFRLAKANAVSYRPRPLPTSSFLVHRA
jgi:hypothetical protein